MLLVWRRPISTSGSLFTILTSHLRQAFEMPDCPSEGSSGRRCLSVSAQEYKLPASERTDAPVKDADPLIKDDSGSAESSDPLAVAEVGAVAINNGQQEQPSEEREDGWWPTYLGEPSSVQLAPPSQSRPLA